MEVPWYSLDYTFVMEPGEAPPAEAADQVTLVPDLARSRRRLAPCMNGCHDADR